MFGSILTELFPNECSVLEIAPNRYVYPIFKNGSSSLYRSGFNLVDKNHLKSIETIEVYVRNPHERFISGVQTYLSNLDPSLDRTTALYFVEKYFFLNRHFCPQLFWLINLARFTKATMTIRPIQELSEITNLTVNQSVRNSELIERFSNNSKIKFYNEMDEVLTVNLCGQTVGLKSIFDVLKSNYDDLYPEAFQYLKDIVNVVPEGRSTSEY